MVVWHCSLVFWQVPSGDIAMIPYWKILPDNLNEKKNLTQFSPMFHSYTPWIRQKSKRFLTFSGFIEMEHWAKMV